MDDIIGPIVLILLIAGIGWIVGIVGYFKANRALTELATLREAIASAARSMSDTSSPAPTTAAAEPAPPTDMPWGPPPDLAQSTAPGPAAPPPPRKRRDLEELLTAKWGVWLGAGALLLAGVFLVRYASDQGLFGPAPRCCTMVLLAVALIAGAEWLRRRPLRTSELTDYAPQALAAGGVGILLGAAYMAASLYNLVPPLIGFALLTAASLAGMLLSLRFGQLVAAIGIVGAFVTPLLVQTSDPSAPGLFAYLLFVTAAALSVVRYTAWVWLGWATTSANAGWVLAATVMGVAPYETWAVALFVPAVAVLNLALLPPAALDYPVGRKLAWVPVAALGAAGLIFALDLQATAQDMLSRIGLLLLVPITIAKAALEPRLGRLPWLSAALFLLLILVWGLPQWLPSGEPITVEGLSMVVLPGDWTPPVLRPLLATSAIVAALFAISGLWFERRTTRPLSWSALVAVVPLLALAILYVRVKAFQPDFLWAGAALVLALAETCAAAIAAREAPLAEARHRAGVHAAGATTALALGFAMLLTDQWLTVAIVLMLPPIAWIEAIADLPPLRHVALAVAGVALVRLLLNPYVLGYAADEMPLLNDLLLVYLAATLGFAATAWMLRRRADDLVVAVLELGSVAFASALVMLQIRHWSTGGDMALPDAGFREAALDVTALGLLALLSLRLEARTGRKMLAWAWRIQGFLALVGAAGLIVFNPAFVPASSIGTLAFLNALLPAYLLPSLLAGLALREHHLPRGARPVLLAYVLVGVFAWITLEVRHLFHLDAMALVDASIEDGELWAWSGAWLVYGLALMAVGVISAQKSLRLAAMAIVALAGAKVFLIDMSGLVGLWRVLSLLGLGLTLIGLGAVYRRFVAGPAA